MRRSGENRRSRRGRQALQATAKAVVIGTMIGAVGFCAGMLTRGE
jgi:hypothetical protein